MTMQDLPLQCSFFLQLFYATGINLRLKKAYVAHEGFKLNICHKQLEHRVKRQGRWAERKVDHDLIHFKEGDRAWHHQTEAAKIPGHLLHWNKT